MLINAVFVRPTFWVLVTLMLLAHGFLYAQTPRTLQLEKDFYRLCNAFQYDSAIIYIEGFLQQANLTNDERYYAHLYRSYIFKRLYDYASTLRCLSDALGYGLQTKNPAYYEANIVAQRALAYFDISEYAKADSLMQVLSANQYAHLNEEYQAKIFMQEAYLLFLAKEYGAAEQRYNLAAHSLKASSPCDLPMILGKKIQLYAEMGRPELIDHALKEAIRIADSCQIMKYKIYVYHTACKGFEKINDYNTSLYYLKLHDSLASIYSNQMHLSKITELDRKYQSQLKDAVIQSKERNTQLLWALVIFLSAGLIVLGILIYILRKQKHIIAEQSKFNQNLVSIISHEIKEPLLGVQFLLNRLKIQDPFLLQASESLANQIQSVNHILNNLLSLRKADAENAPKISQDVRSIILQVSQELDPLFKEKDIALAINVERHFHLPISPEKLKIVLFNLVKNAIKYSPLNQSIRIYQQGKALFIQDFGIGIDSELLPLLLHKAVLSQRGTSNERGNGMGLFLVGQLMKDASIHIEFIAQEKGTLVKVSPI